MSERAADVLGADRVLVDGRLGELLLVGHLARPALRLAEALPADVVRDRDQPVLRRLGPVAALVRFDTEADAIKLANDTPFGLAAYLFSQNLSRAWRVAERLDAGMVGVNEGIFSNEVVPFGGVKESGLGREGAAEGLDEYLEVKYICLGAIDA